MVVLYFVFNWQHIEGMDANTKSFQVVKELGRYHGGIERDGFTQFAKPCVFYDP